MGRGSVVVLVGRGSVVVLVGRGSVVVLVGRGSVVVRTSGSPSREPGFESSCCCFKALANFFIPHCHSSLSCINEYLAIGRLNE